MLAQKSLVVLSLAFMQTAAYADCNFICKGTFVACVTEALTTEGSSVRCVEAVLSDTESSGIISDATVATCGVAADALQQVADNCN